MASVRHDANALQAGLTSILFAECSQLQHEATSAALLADLTPAQSISPAVRIHQYQAIEPLPDGNSYPVLQMNACQHY